MYTYKVTHIPTKQFYIGVEDNATHHSTLVLDPMEVFSNYPQGYNGDVKTQTLFKEIISKVEDKNEAKSHLDVIARHSESDPLFLGIKMTKKPIKSTEVVESLDIQPPTDSKKINKESAK